MIDEGQIILEDSEQNNHDPVTVTYGNDDPDTIRLVQEGNGITLSPDQLRKLSNLFAILVRSRNHAPKNALSLSLADPFESFLSDQIHTQIHWAKTEELNHIKYTYWKKLIKIQDQINHLKDEKKYVHSIIQRIRAEQKWRQAESEEEELNQDDLK